MELVAQISALCFLFTVFALTATNAFDQVEQAKAEIFLENVNKTLVQKSYESSLAAWAFATNITDHNSAAEISTSLAYSKAYAEVRRNASQFDLSKLKEDTARQIKFLNMSTELKNETELRQVEKLRAKLTKFYSTAKVANKSLSPDLVSVMATSRNYSELLHAWWGWRNESGRKMRDTYRQFVDLTNKGAVENGYSDRGEAWRGYYEVDNLSDIVEKLWDDLRPLYLEMHAYVRHKLTKAYPGKVSEDGFIEAHLLGNMWAQNWANIFDLVMPYQNKSSLDITPNLVKDSRYNSPIKLTELAESFFVSLGLKKLPAPFYQKSLLQKPDDREVVCHASAWDFRLYKDVR